MNLETLTLPLDVADKAFNAGIGAAIAGVGALVGAMGMAVKATFKWADELDSIQDVIGGTNEEAAALNFTLRKSGTATDTFNKSMVIMEKGLVKSDGSLDTIGKSLEKWGINVKDSNGKLKTQAQLIGEASKKYNSFSTQQEKVNFLTEVFGKGGADMVDFFDTLSKEGGIDAVTQKVKDFGLVIDPGRYEAFTQSLEEIKLAGLGIAVQFTEKLMPVFEGLMTWFTSLRGLSFTDVLDKISHDFGNLAVNFHNWVTSIDWAQVSASLIAGINGIDWAGLGTKFGDAFRLIFDGIGIIIQQTDWGGLFSSIGTAFLNFMAGLTGQGSWENVKAVWTANGQQLNTIVTSFLAIMKQKFFNMFMSMKNDVSNIFALIKNSIVSALDDAVNLGVGSINTLIDALNAIPLVNIPAIPTLGSSSTGTSGSKTRVTGAGASGGYKSGMTLVGENGPELLNLPSGSYVNTNYATSRMANQPVKAYIDYDELARTMGRVLGQQMQRT